MRFAFERTHQHIHFTSMNVEDEEKVDQEEQDQEVIDPEEQIENHEQEVLQQRHEQAVLQHEQAVLQRRAVIANNVTAGNSVENEEEQRQDDLIANVILGNSVSPMEQYTICIANESWLEEWPANIAEDFDANVPLDAGNIDQAWQDYIKKQFAKVSNDVFVLAFMQDPPEILFSPPNPDEAVTREEILKG